MFLLQNFAVKRTSSVFITFSLCKEKIIFVNNSLKSTFININFALVDHKRKVVYWLRLIHKDFHFFQTFRDYLLIK